MATAACAIIGRAFGAMITGRECGCDDMKVHAPEKFNVGDTWEIQGTLTYADGSPFNLNSGCSIQWALEDNAGNTILSLALGAGISVMDPHAGTCLITILPSQSQFVQPTTDSLFYTDQLRATDPNGVISTQWFGVVNVYPSFFSGAPMPSSPGFATSQVSVGVSPVRLLAARLNRLDVVLQLLSDVPVYVGPDNTVSPTTGAILGGVEVPTLTLPTQGEVWAVSPNGTQIVSVTEFY